MHAEAPRLDINDKQNGDDFSNEATAEARLQEEAQRLRKQPPSFGRRGVRDVTEDFVAASDQLQPGELVKEEYFTLFEAVGALEVCEYYHTNHDFLMPLSSLQWGLRHTAFEQLTDNASRSWTPKWTAAEYLLATPSNRTLMFALAWMLPKYSG